VAAFPGHIACDSESKSEIVVPIIVGGEVGCSSFPTPVSPLLLFR
jgi:hypothetical protein